MLGALTLQGRFQLSVRCMVTTTAFAVEVEVLSVMFCLLDWNVADTSVRASSQDCERFQFSVHFRGSGTLSRDNPCRIALGRSALVFTTGAIRVPGAWYVVCRIKESAMCNYKRRTVAGKNDY